MAKPVIDESATPGPWTIGDAYGCGKGMAICADGQVIARAVEHFGDRMVGGTRATGFDHGKGNARLIAAAPDLLAALMFFRGQYGDSSTWPDDDVAALNLAQAAIDMAVGSKPLPKAEG